MVSLGENSKPNTSLSMAKDCLMKNGLLAADTQTGETQYYVSDSAESFAMLAEPIIGESVADCATQIDIDTY